MIAQGPVLPSAALRNNGSSAGYGRSPRAGKEQSPEKKATVPRYRSAMLDCSPRSSASGRNSPEARKAGAKQARRQRTAMLISDRTPKAKEGANSNLDHSRTAMLMSNKSMEDDGTQSTNSLLSMMQGKVKGLVESVRHRG
ncbi:unnamed protein product [Symbiodinium sp. CCMP2456]|nr:unnamed protein product [Symbiodinium sp. CCMP2456]